MTKNKLWRADPTRKSKTIYYDEDIIKILKKMRDFIKKVKTQDYFVMGYGRLWGYEDTRMTVIDVLDIVIERMEE